MWDYGPLATKENIKRQWRSVVTGSRRRCRNDPPIIPALRGLRSHFYDPLVESLITHKRYRRPSHRGLRSQTFNGLPTFDLETGELIVDLSRVQHDAQDLPTIETEEGCTICARKPRRVM